MDPEPVPLPSATPPLYPVATSRWSASIKKLWCTMLDLQPACLEFVPEDLEHKVANRFVIGTYDLLQDEPSEYDPNLESLESEASGPSTPPQTRNGSLSLWRLSGEEAYLEDTVSHPAGVFDLKFYANTKNFAVAATNGTVSMYQIRENGDNKSQSIIHISTIELFNPRIMITSLAWHSKICSSGVFPIISVTTSSPDCGVYLFFVSDDFVTMSQRPGVSDSIQSPLEPIKRHTDNVWTSTFTSDFTLYSGADDSVLKRSVLNYCRETGMCVEDSNSKPAEFTGHRAGVTTIMVLPFPPGPHGEHLLLTGGYDDYIRIWTTSLLSSTKAKKEAELHIGGCAWRFKMMENYPTQSLDQLVTFRVLGTCMHVGFKIFELQGIWGGDWSIKELAEALEEKVLNYGSAVQPMKSPGNSRRIIASSSFYQKSLSLWSWDPKMSLQVSYEEDLRLQGEGLPILLELKF